MKTFYRINTMERNGKLYNVALTVLLLSEVPELREWHIGDIREVYEYTTSIQKALELVEGYLLFLQ